MNYDIKNSVAFPIANPFGDVAVTSNAIVTFKTLNGEDRSFTIVANAVNNKLYDIPAGVFPTTGTYNVQFIKFDDGTIVPATINVLDTSIKQPETGCGCANKNSCTCDTTHLNTFVTNQTVTNKENILAHEDFGQEICDLRSLYEDLLENYKLKLNEYRDLSGRLRADEGDIRANAGAIGVLQKLTENIQEDERNIANLLEITEGLQKLYLTVDRHDGEIKLNASEIEELKRLYPQLNIRLSGVEEQLTQLKAYLDTNLDAFRQLLNTYNIKLTEVFAWYQGHHAKLEEIELWYASFLVEWQAFKNQYALDLQRIENGMAEMLKRIIQLELDFAALKKELDDYLCGQEKLLDLLKVLQDNLRHLREEFDALVERVKKLEAQICDINKRLTELEKFRNDIESCFNSMFKDLCTTLSPTQKAQLITKLRELAG